MNRFCLCFALILTLNPAMVSAERQGTAAVVGKQVITESDVIRRVRLLAALGGVPDHPDARRSMRGYAIQGLIDEYILAAEATKFKITLGPDAVHKVLMKISKNNNLKTIRQLRNQMEDKGINFDEFIAHSRGQLLRDKFISTLIAPQVQLSKLELEEQERQLSLELSKVPYETSYRIAEIIISKEVPQAEDLIKQIKIQIDMGSDFSKMAREFSQSFTAEKGGELGWLPESQLGKPVQTVLKGLKVGQVSAPMTTAQGYFLIKLLERKSNKVSSEIPSAEELTMFLHQKKIEIRFREYMQKLRSRVFIKINSK